MDRDFVDQNHMVERYVQGRLTDEELTAFELYMLDHPETVDDIEYARGLQQAMRDAAGELRGQPATAVAGRTASWFGPRYALAASVLLVVTTLSTGWLVQRNASLSDEANRLRAPVTVSNEIWLETMRGDETVPVEMRSGAGLWLRAVVDTGDAGPFRVGLRRIDGGFLWTEEGVTKDAEDSVSVLVRDLAVGTYELTVAGTGDDGVGYRFEVVRPD